jgi:hypothetical protein
MKAALNAAKDMNMLDKVGTVKVGADGETTMTMKDGRTVTIDSKMECGRVATENEWDEVFENGNGD